MRICSRGVEDIRLEEIRFDDEQDCWMLTVGFERPRRASINGLSVLLDASARDYKIVSIRDKSAKVIAVASWSLDRA